MILTLELNVFAQSKMSLNLSGLGEARLTIYTAACGLQYMIVYALFCLDLCDSLLKVSIFIG